MNKREKSFSEMSLDERVSYVKMLSHESGVSFEGFNEDYFVFGSPFYYWGKQPEYRRLLEELAFGEEEKVLSDKEIETIYEGEKDTYKIHLNVPDGKQQAVLEHLMSLKKEENAMSERKLLEGDRTGTTWAEAKEAGARLPSLFTWKMKNPDCHRDSSADFVVYARKIAGVSMEDGLESLSQELTGALDDLSLPETNKIPRFSTPVIVDGLPVNGLTYVQGNGDFKAHLRDHRGEEFLARYYDRDKNFAVRVGEGE